MRHARRRAARQFQAVKFVVIPGAQKGAVAIKGREFQPIDAGEEIQTFLEPVGQDFHMAQMGNVVAWLHGTPILQFVYLRRGHPAPSIVLGR